MDRPWLGPNNEPICMVCGGPRSIGSGRMCGDCYHREAAEKKSGTPHGELRKVLAKLEREGKVERLSGDRYVVVK